MRLRLRLVPPWRPFRDPPRPRPTSDQVAAARAIAEELGPLIGRADGAGLDMLAYLLGVVEAEAKGITTG